MWTHSPVDQGGGKAGRGGPGMFWGRGASSKANESKMEKRGGVYSPYTEPSLRTERPRNVQSTHSTPISGGVVRKGVTRVDRAIFRDHIDPFQCLSGASLGGEGDSRHVEMKLPVKLEISDVLDFMFYIINYTLRDHLQGIT